MFFRHGASPPHLRQIGGAGLGGDGILSHDRKLTRQEALGKLEDELRDHAAR
jgi:hypothetical protein